MRRICFYHAGCPDGFGAAWAVRRAWGEERRVRGRAATTTSCALGRLCRRDRRVRRHGAPPTGRCARSARRSPARARARPPRLLARPLCSRSPALGRSCAAHGHVVHFDLDHSGAVLAWRHFHAGKPPCPTCSRTSRTRTSGARAPALARGERRRHLLPARLRRRGTGWQRARREARREGTPILRAQRAEVERALAGAHPVWIGRPRVEAVNAAFQRAQIGHALAERRATARRRGAVYRRRAARRRVALLDRRLRRRGAR